MQTLLIRSQACVVCVVLEHACVNAWVSDGRCQTGNARAALDATRGKRRGVGTQHAPVPGDPPRFRDYIIANPRKHAPFQPLSRVLQQHVYHAPPGILLINFYTRVLARPAAARVVLLHTHAPKAKKDPGTALVSPVLLCSCEPPRWTGIPYVRL